MLSHSRIHHNSLCRTWLSASTVYQNNLEKRVYRSIKQHRSSAGYEIKHLIFILFFLLKPFTCCFVFLCLGGFFFVGCVYLKTTGHRHLRQTKPHPFYSVLSMIENVVYILKHKDSVEI